ncbi:MAG: GGDEF domain-containing protein [Bacilli bacterium]
MNIINIEIYTICIIFCLCVDYIIKYKINKDKNTILLLLECLSIILLSSINILIYLQNSSPIVQSILICLFFVFASVPILLQCLHVNLNYLFPNVKKIKICIFHYIYFILYSFSVLATFLFYPIYEHNIDSYMQASQYKFLLLLILIPILLTFIISIIKKQKINPKIFFALSIPIVGILLDVFINKGTYINVAYTLSLLMLYMLKYDQVINRDPLTGLYNRRFFNNFKFDKDKLNVVYMIDVDNFKTINDTYGHKVGDQTLKKIALSINSSIRLTDYAIRYGGDEFIVIAELKDKAEINKIKNRIYKKLKEVSKTSEFEISVSVGTEIFDVINDEIDEVLFRADKRMYEEKDEKKKHI